MAKTQTHLERTPTRSHQPLSPLHEPLFIPDQPSYLDHIACHAIFQHFRRLREGDASGEEFDEISGREDDVRVECFTGGRYGHGPREEVERACDALVGRPGKGDEIE